MTFYTGILVWMVSIWVLVGQTFVESFEFRAPFPDGVFSTDLLSSPKTTTSHRITLPIDVHDWDVASMGSLIYFCVFTGGKVALNSSYLDMPIRLEAMVMYDSGTEKLEHLTKPINMDAGKTTLRDIYESKKYPFCFYTTACAIWNRLPQAVAMARSPPFAHSVEFRFTPVFNHPSLGEKPKGLEMYAFVGANGGTFTQEAVRGAPYYETIRRTGLLLNPLGDMVLIRGDSQRCAATVTGDSEIGWFRRAVELRKSLPNYRRRDIYQCIEEKFNSITFLKLMEAKNVIGELFYSPAYGTWENYEPRVVQCGYFIMV